MFASKDIQNISLMDQIKLHIVCKESVPKGTESTRFKQLHKMGTRTYRNCPMLCSDAHVNTKKITL